jgi:3-deoxy-D-manno-octulosonic acid (KDO) 8-phosphate synthase
VSHLSACMQDLQESALFRQLKASAPFFLMAGPNVIQSEAHCLKMCRQIKARPQHTTHMHACSWMARVLP